MQNSISNLSFLNFFSKLEITLINFTNFLGISLLSFRIVKDFIDGLNFPEVIKFDFFEVS